MYVERSLDRGYKPNEIGVSATKAFRIKMKGQVQKFKNKFIENGRNQGKKFPFRDVINMF